MRQFFDRFYRIIVSPPSRPLSISHIAPTIFLPFSPSSNRIFNQLLFLFLTNTMTGPRQILENGVHVNQGNQEFVRTPCGQN